MPLATVLFLPAVALITGVVITPAPLVTGSTLLPVGGGLGVAIVGLIIDVAVAGDNFDITVPIPGVPNGQTLTKAWFTAKVDPEVADSGAVVSKIVTTTATADGQITDTGATDLIGEVVFAMSPTDTRAIRDLGPLTFDVQVLTSAGKIYTYMTLCTISVIQEVTLALS